MLLHICAGLGTRAKARDYNAWLHASMSPMNPITGLLTALGAVAALFVGGWAAMFRSSKQKAQMPNVKEVGVGAFTNFFDTLGIGSYATTTAIFRLFAMVDDRVIPGTLN